jgi:hypothetical protein
MKIFFYMGRNPNNKSGLSWKIWKIRREGRRVTAYWGRAALVRRKPVVASKLQAVSWVLGSVKRAALFEADRIEEKLAKGYERRTRWKG